MTPEWNGIERRLERLKGCSLKLEPLKTKTSDEFAPIPTFDPHLGIVTWPLTGVYSPSLVGQTPRMKMWLCAPPTLVVSQNKYQVV
jgi:hypothetical protein